MLKYSTLAIYTIIALFVFSCASGPSSVQFTSAKTKSLRVAHSPPRSTSVPLPKETKLPVKENPKHVVSEHEIIKPAAPESPPDALDAQPSWLNCQP